MTTADDPDRGQLVGDAAEIYDEFFVPALFGQWPPRVLDASGASAGDALLDVGCGTGVLARAATERVTSSGRVVAVDLNDAMLAVAGRAPEPVEWRQAPAEQLPFDDATFDRVVSQFALMFFADRNAGVEEMVRVTRPGGTITVATWARVEDSPGYAAMVTLLDDLFGREAANALLAPFTIGTVEELEAAMSASGLDTTVVRSEGVARFESLDAWVHTDIRGWTLAEMIDDDQFEELRSTARTALAEFVTDDGRVEFAAPALIATATVPA